MAVCLESAHFTYSTKQANSATFKLLLQSCRNLKFHLQQSKCLERGWMLFHLAVASEYLAALCCNQPRFLILSCSAYLASVQSGVCNERHAYTSPHVYGPTAVPHIRPHIQSLLGEVGYAVLYVPLTHTNTCVSPTTWMYEATAGRRGQTRDPAPGDNDRFRGCCGWRWTEAGLWRICVTFNMQRWRGVMTSSV